MQEIKSENLRQMWRQAAGFDDNYNQIDYGLDTFSEGYCRYFGCGHHLYILVKGQYDKLKVLEIGNQRGVHPRTMAQQLGEVASEYRVIMIDVEIGGMSVLEAQNDQSDKRA